MLGRSNLILTDSGGIQEEAAALNKKMLVLRNTTERQELVDSGFTKLVGSNSDVIASETLKLLDSKELTEFNNPYGNGDSASKIVDVISSFKF